MRIAHAGSLRGQAASNCQANYEAMLTGIAKQFYESFKRSRRCPYWQEKIKDSKTTLDFAIPLYSQFCGSITRHSEEAKRRR